MSVEIPGGSLHQREPGRFHRALCTNLLCDTRRADTSEYLYNLITIVMFDVGVDLPSDFRVRERHPAAQAVDAPQHQILLSDGAKVHLANRSVVLHVPTVSGRADTSIMPASYYLGFIVIPADKVGHTGSVITDVSTRLPTASVVLGDTGPHEGAVTIFVESLLDDRGSGYWPAVRAVRVASRAVRATPDLIAGHVLVEPGKFENPFPRWSPLQRQGR